MRYIDVKTALVPTVLVGTYAARRVMTKKAADAGADASKYVYEPADATEKVIRFYEERIERDPIDAHSCNKLAAAYMQRARETGDVAYYERAEKVLEQSLDILPEENNYTATALFAAVSFSLHQFQAARDWAQQAVAIKPQDSYAYGQLGDACVELGEYERASTAYQQMIRLSRSLYSYSRWSHFKDLMGDTGGAIRAMREAVEAGRKGAATARENLAWCQMQLGTLYFNTGDLGSAEEHYSAALQTFASYHRALAGLAKVRAAQKNYAEAIALYQQAIARVPDPDAVAALGDLYQQVGQPGQAKRQYDLIEYIGALAKINRAIYNRQLALFYADHDQKLAEALALAQKELEARKDIYGYDALAWALYKNGRYQDALQASQRALGLGTKDALLYYHLGMIQTKLDHPKEAAAALQRALDINPYFHPLHAEEARLTLQRLGMENPAHSLIQLLGRN